jgi:hypothetical protein
MNKRTIEGEKRGLLTIHLKIEFGEELGEQRGFQLETHSAPQIRQ